MLFIGWWREPGVKDEPQHIKQGNITFPRLVIIGISYHPIRRYTEGRIATVFSELLPKMSNRKTVAFIVKKVAFQSECTLHYGNMFIRTRESAILAVSGPVDVFICTTSKL